MSVCVMMMMMMSCGAADFILIKNLSKDCTTRDFQTTDMSTEAWIKGRQQTLNCPHTGCVRCVYIYIYIICTELKRR